MPPLRPPLRQTTRGLTDAQNHLVQIMRAYRFGRIENLSVSGGQPIFDENVRVVRTKHLSGSSAAAAIPGAGDFELKKSVCALFDELERLRNGMVTRLEFRHGLPYLLETTASPLAS